MKEYIVKRPIDLACEEEDRVCDNCNNDEFKEVGCVDYQNIYQCTKCGELSYGMD